MMRHHRGRHSNCAPFTRMCMCARAHVCVSVRMCIYTLANIVYRVFRSTTRANTVVDIVDDDQTRRPDNTAQLCTFVNFITLTEHCYTTVATLDTKTIQSTATTKILRILISLTSKLSSEIKYLHFGKTEINKLQKYTKNFSREIHFFSFKIITTRIRSPVMNKYICIRFPRTFLIGYY